MTQTDEVPAIPGAGARGHPMSVIRAPGGALDSILRGASSCTPSREEALPSSTPAPRPSPDASSSEAESVCVPSSHFRVPLRTNRTPGEEGDPPPVPTAGGLLSAGFASPADVLGLGVWTYPLCDSVLPRLALRDPGLGLGAVRLACEAPDRRVPTVHLPELYHGLLGTGSGSGTLHYGAAGSAEAGSAIIAGFPWPGALHYPPAVRVSPSKTPSSPTLKFGMDRILSGDVSSQDTKSSCSPGLGTSCSRPDCGVPMSSLGPLNYASLMAPTPLRIFSHATSSQLTVSRTGAQSGVAASGGSGKRKRSWSRAVFSNLQRKGLEKRFQLQKYITKPDRRQLAATLGLTDAQVKVWFQNRRMKWRHTKEAKSQQPGQTVTKTLLGEPTEENLTSTNL